MTREEAARVLTRGRGAYERDRQMGDERVLFETYKTALRMGAAAPREPPKEDDDEQA